MSTLAEDLRGQITGEVRDDAISRSVYSVDASIYEITPQVIALPRTQQELVTAIRSAAHHKVPIIPRGAATGIAGGCIGDGLILDTSKYLHAILSINPEQRFARCEPGVVQSALNAAVKPFGLRLGPDTSTGNRATLGGMLANNSGGARSLHYGTMVDHIQEVHLVLSNGERMHCRALTDEELREKLTLQTREGHIYREVLAIQKEYAADIAEHIPPLPRRASGYTLNTLYKAEPLNLSRLIAGSEGSLGVISELQVRLAPLPRVTGLCLLQFLSLHDAFAAVTAILQWHPLALELIDEKIIIAGRKSPSLAKRTGWIVGDPKAVLIVEFEAGTAAEVHHRCQDFVAFAQECVMGYAANVATDAKEMGDVWAVREGGLGLLLSKRSYSRAFAFLEDIAVPPAVLAPFMQEFLDLLHANGKDAGVYGHVGAGAMHVRPYVDLRDPAELKLMEKLMQDTTQLLLRYHGALSGEHGDGLVRSWLNETLFGPRVYEAFCRLKRAFDPEGLMNPGKVVATQRFAENLRVSTDAPPFAVETFLDFSREGGIQLAADLCNGNGLCRKREGLMCPSFQAFGDEFHTTRARAQSFRDVFSGKLPADGLTSPGLHRVLEYCLECKGCKTECPSQVDMAKMKSEFLYQYQKKHGIPLRSRLFGAMSQLYWLMSPVARLFNWGAQTGFAKWILTQVGITPDRPLPALAHERFSKWFAGQPKAEGLKGSVVLFNDSYTEFVNPEIGQAAVKVLHALGYEVLVPSWRCCGRPQISKGLLPQARKKGNRLVDQLWPYAQRGLPIIGLEPSCLSALTDDYRDLLTGEKSQAVKAVSVSLEEFLAQHVDDLKTVWPAQKEGITHVWVHTHCHQKALVGTQAAQRVLAALPGIQAHDMATGCCGLAGSFGYEVEHFDFSLAIAEQTILPVIRRVGAGDVLIANGLSCRSQIQYTGDRKAIHLAQFLASRLTS